MSPVVLVGLMGSGKSTVGRLLAKRWGIPFVDLDAEIERASGLSIKEIFEREGEAGFRAREADATRDIAPPRPLVTLVGGGRMVRPARPAAPPRQRKSPRSSLHPSTSIVLATASVGATLRDTPTHSHSGLGRQTSPQRRLRPDSCCLKPTLMT